MDKNLHALVIDDEPQVREFVSAVLQGEDWAVTQSGSAVDAFARLGEAKWSVVFCDVMLGGADGFAVLRRFKQELPGAKVVLMTGHGSAAGELQDATAHGVPRQPWQSRLQAAAEEFDARVPVVQKEPREAGSHGRAWDLTSAA